MKVKETKIKDLVIIEPAVYGDDRGYFMESFNAEWFEKNVCDTKFIQDNESKSTKGVLRGLHFQKPPYAQAKLVRVIEGEVLDVAVDLRQDSPTYGQHETILLSGDNKKQFFVPRGFAHGFVVLSETAIFSYKVDNRYAPTHDSGILWNDVTLDIDWELDEAIIQLSEKDKIQPKFEHFTAVKY
jgi:dTDP-4-dehydrorhamnose 3,5-epimerase